MRHGKNPTVRQKKFLKSKKLNPDNWLVSSDTPQKMIIIHRNTSTTKTIPKGDDER